jgi:tetratricopeptide (TPR) repeat protein
MKLYLYSGDDFQYTAWSIQAALAAEGHVVLLDMDNKPRKTKPQELLAADYLLLILSPYSFQGGYQSHDPLRIIVQAAIERKIPIIPLLFFDERFDSPRYQKYFHESVQGIRQFEPLSLNFADWGAFIETLKQRLLPLENRPEGDFRASELVEKDEEGLATGRKAEEFYARGNHAYMDKDYETAKAAHDEAIALLPEFGSAYNSRSLALSKLEKLDEGLADSEIALRLKGDEATIWSNRALLYLEANRDKDSYDAASKAIELNPELAPAYNNRGLAQRNQGLLQEALLDFDEAIKLENLAVAYHNRYLIREKIGMLDETLNDLDMAIELDASAAEYYRSRSLWYKHQGQLEEAFEDNEEAIRLADSPQVFGRAYNDRAVFHSLRGNYKKAIEDYDRSIEQSPNDAVVYWNRADAYRHLGDYQKALESVSHAIDLEPSHDFYIYRSKLYTMMNNREASQSDLEKANEFGFDTAEEHLHRGFIYYEQKKFEAALADFNKALSMDANSVEALNARAKVYADIYQDDSAFRDYGAAIALESDFAEVYQNRGLLYLRHGEHEKALADFNKAIELDATEASFFYHRADFYLSLGKGDLAFKDIQQAIELEKDNHLFYLLRANYHLANGNVDAARRDLDRSIELKGSVKAYLLRATLNKADKGKAKADYRRVLKLDPKNKDAQDALEDLEFNFWTWLKELFFGKSGD